jgi:CRP-like cAMP-binding protein
MLRGLDTEELLDICGPARTIPLKPGEFLFHEGHDAYALYVVKSGSVRVVSGSTVYETVSVGGIVGEMAIIEGEMPRSASVIAATHAELIEIDEESFLSLIATKPEFALTVMRTITRRLRVMNRRYRSRRAFSMRATATIVPVLESAE